MALVFHSVADRGPRTAFMVDTGAVVGELYVVVLTFQSEVPGGVTEDPWTGLTIDAGWTVAPLTVHGGSTPTVAIVWKIVAEGDAGSTVNFALGGDTSAQMIRMRFDQFDQVRPMDYRVVPLSGTNGGPMVGTDHPDAVAGASLVSIHTTDDGDVFATTAPGTLQAQSSGLLKSCVAVLDNFDGDNDATSAWAASLSSADTTDWASAVFSVRPAVPARTRSRPLLVWELMISDSDQFTLGAGSILNPGDLEQSRLDRGNLLGPLVDDSAWIGVQCKCTAATWQVGTGAPGLGRRTPMSTGYATGTFWDPTRELDPTNDQGPYSTYLGLGNPVRIRADWEDGTDPITLWIGEVEEFHHAEDYTILRCRDFLSRLAKYDAGATQLAFRANPYNRLDDILAEAQWTRGTDYGTQENTWNFGALSFAEPAWTTIVKTLQNVHGYCFQNRAGQLAVRTPEEFWPLGSGPGRDPVWRFDDPNTYVLDIGSMGGVSLRSMINVIEYGEGGSGTSDGVLTDAVLASRFGAQRYERMDLYLALEAQRTAWAQEMLDSANRIALGNGGMHRLGIHPHRDPPSAHRDALWDRVLTAEPCQHWQVFLPTLDIITEGLAMGVVHTVTPGDWMVELIMTEAPNTGLAGVAPTTTEED